MTNLCRAAGEDGKICDYLNLSIFEISGENRGTKDCDRSKGHRNLAGGCESECK